MNKHIFMNSSVLLGAALLATQVIAQTKRINRLRNVRIFYSFWQMISVMVI